MKTDLYLTQVLASNHILDRPKAVVTPSVIICLLKSFYE